MLKSNAITVFSLKIDLISLLMFFLVSLGYPSFHKYVFPLIIALGLVQFYRGYSKQVELSYLLEINFYLLVFSLIFYRSIHTSLLILNLIFHCYNFSLQKNKIACNSLRAERLILFFFILILINQLSFQPIFKSIDTYLHLLFYPVLFYFIKRSRSGIDVTKAMFFYLFSVLISTTSLIIINILSGTLEFKANTFFAEPLGLTHVYFGLFLGAACSIVYILIEKKKGMNIKWSLCFIALFFSLIIYIGARMALLAVLFVSATFIIKKVRKLGLQKAIFLVVFMCGILTISYNTFPRLKDGINYAQKVYISVTNDDQKDLVHNSWRNMYQRFLVTKYTLNEIKRNIFFGVGLHNVKQTLGDKIHDDGYLYYKPINPHNQYLHIWLGMGVFSFLFFLYMLFELMKNQPMGLYFTLFFLISMMTESILVREKGISLFFLFLLIFYLNKKGT